MCWKLSCLGEIPSTDAGVEDMESYKTYSPQLEKAQQFYQEGQRSSSISRPLPPDWPMWRNLNEPETTNS